MLRRPDFKDWLVIVLVVLIVLVVTITAGRIEGFLRALISPAAAQSMGLQGVALVVDGDTLDLQGQRIRLHGIDAPERGQSCKDADGMSWPCGQRAALALADRIGRRPVTCVGTGSDTYGRIIAICYRNDVDLNAWLVANGHAQAYRKYSRDYVTEEEQAQRAQLGIWAGRFIAPWDWRRGDRLDPVAASKPNTAPDGCGIKGNINRDGVRIYHMPGQQHYSRTRINTGTGERWFCSEAEAQAAGWRRAGR